MRRLTENGEEPFMLKRQYRMHPVIAKFSSDTFYHGRIENGVDEDDRTYDDDSIPWPNERKPIMFWNVPTHEEYTGVDQSRVNTRESTYVAELVSKFHENGVEAEKIAIICPYLGQVEYLAAAINHLSEAADDWLDDVEIDTIDAFQGREKDFIIFSCVRGNDKNTIGFLANEERMNVALTRAKYGLIVGGNAQVFCENEKWSDFIEYCDGLKTFVEGVLGRWRRSRFVRKRARGGGDSDDDQ
jgi:regulator of nonsense transcripts 1